MGLQGGRESVCSFSPSFPPEYQSSSEEIKTPPGVGGLLLLFEV